MAKKGVVCDQWVQGSGVKGLLGFTCDPGSGCGVPPLRVGMTMFWVARIFRPFNLSSFRPFVLSSFHPFVLSSFRPFILSSFCPFVLLSFHPFVLSSFRPFILLSFRLFVFSSFIIIIIFALKEFSKVVKHLAENKGDTGFDHFAIESILEFAFSVSFQG